MTLPYGTGRIHALTSIGYNILKNIAHEQPSLIRTGTAEDLYDEMRRRHTGPSDNYSAPLFSERSWPIQMDLSNLMADPVPGPSHDAVHAEWIYKALPTVTTADMSDQRILSAINCFHLPGYSNIRWKSSRKLWDSTDPVVQTKFTINHWLGDSKESNTVARLWWLYAFAQQAAAYSEHDTSTLLEAMANHVSFYHQLMRRKYLRASPRIRASILDVSIQNGLLYKNNTAETSRMMQALNLTAGGIGLDILSDNDLREVIKGVMPPKEGVSPDPQP
ncbi:MAG: DUF6339 family protein [bacterium]|nr:DUF6339 family protein [bacterium]